MLAELITGTDHDESRPWIYAALDGTVKMLNRSLPGRLAISVARQNNILWMILDLDKPEARRNLTDLLVAWRGQPRNSWAAEPDAGTVTHPLNDFLRLVMTTNSTGGRCTADAERLAG